MHVVEHVNVCFQIYVLNEDKDERYWTRRIKNNIAARRSREMRRVKENQIALRVSDNECFTKVWH